MYKILNLNIIHSAVLLKSICVCVVDYKPYLYKRLAQTKLLSILQLLTLSGVSCFVNEIKEENGMWVFFCW